MKNITKSTNIFFLLSFLFKFSLLQPQDLIDQIIIKKNKVTIKANPIFKKKYLNKEDFFVEYDEAIDLTTLDESIVIMPFIMNVLSTIWASGETYYIDSMDSELFKSLKLIKKIFHLLYLSNEWNGKLIPKKLVTNTITNQKNKETDVAMLFSGGLDSICSSFRHLDKNQLLITVWGNFDLKLNKPQLWYQTKNSLEQFAQTYGHLNSFIRSNYFNFINRKAVYSLVPEITFWRMQTIEGLGWAGLCAPILISKGYNKLYIGSSVNWDYPFKQLACPTIDNNIQFAGISIEHDAFTLSRVEKNEYIANLCKEKNLQKPILKVCIHPTSLGNCCECEKCYMTIAGFLCIDESFKDYGFNISKEKAENRIKHFLKNFLNEETLMEMRLWHFQCIQHKAEERKNKSIKLSPFLSWLITLKIDEKINLSKLQKINYKKLDNYIELIKKEKNDVQKK